MTWDPAQYLEFAEPRLRPAIDLLARVDLATPRAIADLGCGAGNVTRLLSQRWPDASVTAVDDSPEMLAVAARTTPGVRWIGQDLASWSADRPLDLVFSNAALHWLPDHPALFPHLLRQLAPGGQLAVQMPRNFHAPSHTLLADTVREGPWAARLTPLLRTAPVGEPADYHAMLSPLADRLDIWQTEYLHVLHGPDPVKAWTKGTVLKPLLDALDAPARAVFEADYAARLRRAYPPGPRGETLFPFRRLFVVARRGPA